MSRIRQADLPNGWKLHYRHELDRRILTREFVTDDVYCHELIKLEDGDCVFDVGANLGSFCLWLAGRIGSGQVFCFEPIPQTFELLKLNTENVTQLKVQLANVALADREGRAEFAVPLGLSVSASMVEDNSALKRAGDRQFIAEELASRHGWLKPLNNPTVRRLSWPLLEGIRVAYGRKQKIDCQLSTVSAAIRENSVARINLLKIDVEGAESQVLDGIDLEHWDCIDQLLVECHLGAEHAQGLSRKIQQFGFTTDVQPVTAGVDHLWMLVASRR